MNVVTPPRPTGIVSSAKIWLDELEPVPAESAVTTRRTASESRAARTGFIT